MLRYYYLTADGFKGSQIDIKADYDAVYIVRKRSSTVLKSHRHNTQHCSTAQGEPIETSVKHHFSMMEIQ